jgi:uncharacterized protein (TIGR03067 family)
MLPVAIHPFRGASPMKKADTASIWLAWIVLMLCCASSSASDPKKSLIGVWQAVAMERGGMPAPKEAVAKIRFTFEEGKLLVRGNFQDEREVACTYQIDLQHDPMRLDFQPPEEKKKVFGIFRFRDEQLEVCLRNASSDLGRPDSFQVQGDPSLVLILFRKQP